MTREETERLLKINSLSGTEFSSESLDIIAEAFTQQETQLELQEKARQKARRQKTTLSRMIKQLEETEFSGTLTVEYRDGKVEAIGVHE